MLSTPPPITRPDWPDMTWAAAELTASSPEAQKRFTCCPGTELSKPAFSTAVRAMLAPCSPTGVTQPRITSSTFAVSR